MLIPLVLIALYGAVVAFASPGRVDPSFGSSGVTTIQLGAGPSASERASGVNALLRQPDGKYVIAGFGSTSQGLDRLVLARLLRGGRLFDRTFGTNGRVVRSITGGDDGTTVGRALARRVNGRILVAGDTGTQEAPGAFVAQFDSRGRLDPTFGSGGIVRLDGLTAAAAVVVGPAGRTYVVGTAEGANDTDAVGIVGLSRYGRPLADFGRGRPVVLQLGVACPTCNPAEQPSSSAVGARVQHNGRIVVAGVASNVAGGNEIVVTRLLGNGVVEPTYAGGTGTARIHPISPLNTDVIARSVSLDSRQRVVVAGRSDRGMVVARLTSSGLRDRTFGRAGALVTTLLTDARAVGPLRNGRILLAGFANLTENRPQVAVARLRSNGARDLSFGSSRGVFRHQYGDRADPASRAEALAVDPGGRGVVVAGSTGQLTGIGQRALLFRLQL
jgi:uncharacterized delta-60 repeat protein